MKLRAPQALKGQTTTNDRLPHVKAFVPLFQNPHLQTVAGHFWPRRRGRFPVEQQLFGSALVMTQRPVGVPRGGMVLVHGLEGSAEAGYMQSAAQRGVEAGYVAHRFNVPAVYHGGLTGDLLAVLRGLIDAGSGPLWLVGFSLGGNLVLKLAGELGEDARPLIAGICAASPAIDLAACAERIRHLDNRPYEYRFVVKMRARARAVWQATSTDLRGLRSVIAMDDRITAPHFGFSGAAEYYATQSACRFLDRIRVPTLVIAAKDDTFIPFRIFDHPAFRQNPCLRLLATDHGGHLGFIARHPPRLWLDHAIMEWVTGTIGTLDSSGY